MGGLAVAGLVMGSGYAVYRNIFAASVYPSVGHLAEGGIEHERPAGRSASQAVRDVFAALPQGAGTFRAKSEPSTLSQSAFNDRFAAAAADGVPSRAAEAIPAETQKIAESKPAESRPADRKVADRPKQQLALAAPATKPAAPAEARSKDAAAENAKPAAPGNPLRDMAERAKAAVMSIAAHENRSMVDRLWGTAAKPSSNSLLSYASADASITSSISETREKNPAFGNAPPYDRSTAVYIITKRKVYLPDGTELEAHSGLGSKLDDPGSASIRMRGVTPPHIYDLKPREALFHGVPALRLTPIGGEEAIFGRNGLLAHTYMLGPNGDSNGCVSFKDYYAFLDAYNNKGIKKLAVIARLD